MPDISSIPIPSELSMQDLPSILVPPEIEPELGAAERSIDKKEDMPCYSIRLFDDDVSSLHMKLFQLVTQTCSGYSKYHDAARIHPVGFARGSVGYFRGQQEGVCQDTA